MQPPSQSPQPHAMCAARLAYTQCSHQKPSKCLEEDIANFAGSSRSYYHALTIIKGEKFDYNCVMSETVPKRAMRLGLFVFL